MGNVWQTIWIKIPLVLSNRTPIQSSLRTEVEWLAWGPRGDLAVTLFFRPLVPSVPRVLNPWALQRPCYGQWWVERRDAQLQTGSWVTACHRGRLGVFLFKPFFPFVLFRKWCPWETWRRTSGVRPWQKPLELLPPNHEGSNTSLPIWRESRAKKEHDSSLNIRVPRGDKLFCFATEIQPDGFTVAK